MSVTDRHGRAAERDPSQPRSGVRHPSTALSLLTLTAVFAALAWKVSLPNNQHRDLDTYGTPAAGEPVAQVTAGYDDVVTIVTAHNFARDGFLRTHFLPNRKFAPLVSYFDPDGTQCNALEPPARPIRYRNPWGVPVDMVSLDSDCIYTHYPPLADWFYGAMASVGLDRVLHYKLAAVLLSCTFLFLLFRWLRTQVAPAAALGALLFLALSPAFFEWAGALYYQSFQYLFLFAGLLSIHAWTEGESRRAWLATWALFFCEALVSPELVLFFALVVCYAVLRTARWTWRGRLGAVLGLATAPVAAVGLHLGLRASLFGWEATVDDVLHTFLARATSQPGGWGVEVWFDRIHHKLLPLVLMGAGLLAIALEAGSGRARLRRRFALLGVFLAGGLSFTAVLPGTAMAHSWMMYRHLMPFVTLLVAFALDGAIRAAAALAPGSGARPSARAAAVATIACAGVVLGWSALRSARAIRAEAEWLREVAQHHDPRNQGIEFLDVVSWSDRGTLPYDLGNLHVVDGRRTGGMSARFGVLPDSHLDVWWLERRSFGEAAVATDEAGAQRLASSCRIESFDGRAFVPAACSGSVRVEADPDLEGIVWARFPCAGSGRALQLSCGALEDPVLIHELEVYGGAR